MTQAIRKRWAFPATDRFIEVTFFAIEKTRGRRKSTRLAKHGCPTMALDGLGPEHSELIWAAVDEAMEKVLAALRRQPAPPAKPAPSFDEQFRAHFPPKAETAQGLRPDSTAPAPQTDAVIPGAPPPVRDEPGANPKEELDELRAFEAKRDAAMRGT